MRAFYHFAARYLVMNFRISSSNLVVAGIVSQPQHYRLSSASDESPIKVLPLR